MNKKYKQAFYHLLIDTVNRNFEPRYIGELLLTMVEKYNIIIDVDAIKESFDYDNCEPNDYLTFDEFKDKYNQTIKQTVTNHVNKIRNKTK